MAKIIKVVAGALCRDGQVLLTSRPIGKNHAGCWEFPGGKIEAHESIFDAIIRELREELGIIVNVANLNQISFIEQIYDNVTIQLDVVLVTKWANKPLALEGQQLFWQSINDPCLLAPLLPTTQKILDGLKTI